MRFLKSLYINNAFFWYLALLCALFVLSYWVTALYPIAWLASLLLLAAALFDIYLLYGTGNTIQAERTLPKKMSNSDSNPVRIDFGSHYKYKTLLDIIDELPEQFQKRDFKHDIWVVPKEDYTYEYHVRPVDRGVYRFGQLNIYASSPIRIIKRRFRFQKDQEVPVYPSILQMQQYDFLAIHNQLSAVA